LDRHEQLTVHVHPDPQRFVAISVFERDLIHPQQRPIRELMSYLCALAWPVIGKVRFDVTFRHTLGRDCKHDSAAAVLDFG
jgi:hypothetical protein